MLPKKNRIKKKKDFELIFKKGTSTKNPLLILRVLKTNLNYSRFGFVVSQKISKRAVVRNKVRRRLSVVIKNELSNIKIGLDMVFIALPEIEKKGFLETKQGAISLLLKAKTIIKEKK